MKSHIIVYILRLVMRELLPWLKEQAQETDTPLDDGIVEVIAELLKIDEEK